MQFDAQFRKQLEAIVTHAGKQLLEYQGSATVLAHKAAGDVVTSADVASEQYLIKELGVLLPQASFLAEESGSLLKQSDYCWVIDPLDGTTNFIHGFPYFAVSVAVTYKGVPQIGVLYDPTRQELFYAQTGHGAWVNGERVQIPLKPLKRKLILIATPYQKDGEYAARIRCLFAYGPEQYAFRHTGSVALDCAYVACGRADGLFFMDLTWWDIAAGIVILQEAGMQVVGNGMVTEADITYPLLIAGSHALVEELSTIIGQ